MASLKDSGTFGRYSSGVSPFSSQAYGRYSPSTPDYAAKFYACLRNWRFETLTASSTDDIFNNESFRTIVSMGDIVLPLIVAELRRRPDFLFAAMGLITGKNPITPRQVGDIAAMTQAWIEWYDRQR